MNNNKMDFKNFFFADTYRIIIIIILILSLILDILIILLISSLKEKAQISMIFICILNSMFCGFLSGLGYIFNWVIIDPQNQTHLLFGHSGSFLCLFQSFMIGFFQESREIFATLITVIFFLKSCEIYFSTSTKNIVILFLIAYLLPLVNTILILLFGGFGTSDHFCFFKKNAESKIFGKIHTLLFLCVPIGISLLLMLLLVCYTCNLKKENQKKIKKYKKVKSESNKDEMNENKDKNESSDFGDSNEAYDKTDFSSRGTSFLNVILFPIGQILFNIVPIIYRLNLLFPGKEGNYELGGVASVLNTAPALVYTIIFAINSGVLRMMNFRIRMMRGDSLSEEVNQLINKDVDKSFSD